MVVSPVKSQYGIVGYVANIYFKDGAKKIQLYKDRQDTDIIQEFEEISMFIMGKNAQNNELKGDCDCSKGGCYCICCKNWVLVAILFIVIAAAYIGGSFGLAISQNCGSFLESNCWNTTLLKLQFQPQLHTSLIPLLFKWNKKLT